MNTLKKNSPYWVTNVPAVVILFIVLFLRGCWFGVGSGIVIGLTAAICLGYAIALGAKKKMTIEHTLVSGLAILVTTAVYFAVGYFDIKPIAWAYAGFGILIAYFIYLCISKKATDKIATDKIATDKITTECVLLYCITLFCSYFLTA